jgi:mycothiol synthase
MPANNATPYIIRNYQPADFDNYVRLRQEAERLEPRGWPVSPQVISEILSWPNHSPEQNLFVIFGADSIIGYMDMMPELSIGRVILDCWLHPEHRRKGLATKLLGYATRRAGELGAGDVQVNVMEDNAVARTVLSRLGFRSVRRFLELELDMTRLRGQEADQAAQQCCHLGHDEEEKLTYIQNRCFAGTWGYNINTVETMTYRTHLRHFSPEDITLAYDGDKVTGYCWTWVIPHKDKQKGRIYMLGVDPDYRGKGMGRRLLLAGLSHLRSKGISMAVLTVDSENEAACALYRSVGFEFQAGSLWYERAVTWDSKVL